MDVAYRQSGLEMTHIDCDGHVAGESDLGGYSAYEVEEERHQLRPQALECAVEELLKRKPPSD